MFPILFTYDFFRTLTINRCNFDTGVPSVHGQCVAQNVRLCHFTFANATYLLLLESNLLLSKEKMERPWSQRWRSNILFMNVWHPLEWSWARSRVQKIGRWFRTWKHIGELKLTSYSINPRVYIERLKNASINLKIYTIQ